MTRMRTYYVILQEALEVLSLGWWGYQTLFNCLQGLRMPGSQPGMVDGWEKGLSSEHKLKGVVTGGQWEQRGTLHEAYLPP